MLGNERASCSGVRCRRQGSATAPSRAGTRRERLTLTPVVAIDELRLHGIRVLGNDSTAFLVPQEPCGCALDLCGVPCAWWRGAYGAEWRAGWCGGSICLTCPHYFDLAPRVARSATDHK
eukprot:6304995-Prymnesium_polylepis.3